MTSAFFHDEATDSTITGVERKNETAERPAAVGHKRRRLKIAALSRAAFVQTLASLIWIPQAALLAYAVGAIADGAGLSAVTVPALVILALGILRSGMDAAGGRMAFLAARAELTARREAATAALAARSPLDAGRTASGEAASLIAEQAEMIVPYLARFQPARSKASTIPPVMLACVLPISWVAALIMLFTAPLIPVFMALIGWRAKAASEEQLAETGGLNAFLLDRLRGLSTIRALDAVETTAGRLRADAESLRARTMAVLKIAFLSSAVLELFAALGVAAIAVYIGFSLLGSIDVGTWHGKLTLTQGLFILLLAPAFFEPLRELSAVWHDRAAGEAGLDALDRLSAGDQAVLDVQGEDIAKAAPNIAAPSLRIENLCYLRGPGQAPVFDNFNLTVWPGEHVALLGASGTGKTTLLSLIAGLAPSDCGTIRVGDMPLTDATAGALRRRMIWIGQQPHIFAGTIAGNVSLGRPEITRDAVLHAIDHVHLQHVLEAQGSAQIGENGLGLSGGEALRVALARASVESEADIILADEPTAHLDAETARDITDGLLALARGRTLIIATHDPVLAARMNRTIRIDAHAEEAAA